MDIERRANLQSRIDAARTAAADYFADAHESLQSLHRQVINHLDDAQGLLRSESVQPDYFLPMVEMFLGMAMRQLESSKAMIDKYGGPRNARLVG